MLTILTSSGYDTALAQVIWISAAQQPRTRLGHPPRLSEYMAHHAYQDLQRTDTYQPFRLASAAPKMPTREQPPCTALASRGSSMRMQINSLEHPKYTSPAITPSTNAALCSQDLLR